MGTFTQILLGTAVLIGCSLVHVVVLVWAAGMLVRVGRNLAHFRASHRSGVLIGAVFGTVVFSHTLQVWIWAGVFILMGALHDVGRSIYFSLVTYTTLGYGDVTLADDFQVFGAMAAVTGLLTFGLSTAFLAGLLSRLLPHETS
ncbi:MAG: ion channel [Pseudomonadota bacterium]